MKKTRDVWWGEFVFEEKTAAQWEIGPLCFTVQRLSSEWLVALEQIDVVESHPEWRFSYRELDLNTSEISNISRFVCQETPEKLTVLPALADRSVVSRPYTPFSVPVDESATIYLSTPLWVTLAFGQPLRTLYEFPLRRPSDTWFGSTTIEGETCYASRTYGRLNLDTLSGYYYRALTEVHIQNNTAVPLLIERINVPVPFLSLFQAQEDLLWTETVTMVQNQESSMAELHIQKEPPPSAINPKLVASPRQKSRKSMLIRAFGGLKIQGF
jgi:hypothetical protein